MHRHRLLLAVASLSVVFSASAASVPTREIERFASEVVDGGRAPGVIVGVWNGGSRTALIRKGTPSLPPRAPMHPANHQRIGSITKSFTVTRILQLADKGLLDLDDPIGDYVPGLRNGDATLRELANMTSGIFNYTEDTPFVVEFFSDLTRGWTNRQLVAVANSRAPYFRPGHAWHYSNTNTILLGMVVQRVTGNSLRDEITRHLLRPLGLRATTYPRNTPALPPPFNRGYILDSDEGWIDVTALNPSALSGAGAMISTLDDLATWGRALATARSISRVAQAERLRMIFAAGGVGPFYDRYGLGMGAISGWLGHTGDVPGYQNLVMHNVVADQTVVILVNASSAEHVPTEIFRRIAPLLAPANSVQPVRIGIRGKTRRATTARRLRLRGRASARAGLLLVQVGSRGKIRAAKGARIWRAPVRLRPGRNVFVIRAIDRLGNRSATARLRIRRR